MGPKVRAEVGLLAVGLFLGFAVHWTFFLVPVLWHLIFMPAREPGNWRE